LQKISKMTGKTKSDSTVDVVLIGAGIMSATLGVLLKELQPDLSIEIFERLDVAAAKRFIVVKKVEKEFVRLFKNKMAARITGDPFDADTNLGPMSRLDLRDDLHERVKENIKAGAKCILGGQIPDFKGRHAYYTPTILIGIKKGMPAYEEEIFGPVALVISAKDTDDAIRIANDTPFGLGAAVFTKDGSLGEQVAKTHLNAGSCFVNSLVKSDPRLPFGGINQSGYGRELGLFGIREFVNIKTVYIK
jgi:succinate-semialdehyde dehydrogenase/glutarate-semialdehyde dehydrogenase